MGAAAPTQGCTPRHHMFRMPKPIHPALSKRPPGSEAARPCVPLCSAEADLTRRGIVDLDIRTGGLLSLTRQGPPQVGRREGGAALRLVARSRAGTHVQDLEHPSPCPIAQGF